MGGNYQKFEIKMELENSDFRLWKNGQDEAVCRLETYKEKRSVFFFIRNLLPSKELWAEKKGEYHVLLLGVEDGSLFHKDFGSFSVDSNGEGSFFRKFGGVELTCYTHCLLVAVYEGREDPEVVYRGETPFFVRSEPACNWTKLKDRCQGQQPLEVFSSEMDETGAKWFRITDFSDFTEIPAGARELMERYHHCIFGYSGEECYLGIPGRFLKREQPCREEGWFLLWQPLRGGEAFFDRCESMDRSQQEEIFGYWIAGIDMDTGALKPL